MPVASCLQSLWAVAEPAEGLLPFWDILTSQGKSVQTCSHPLFGQHCGEVLPALFPTARRLILACLKGRRLTLLSVLSSNLSHESRAFLGTWCLRWAW